MRHFDCIAIIAYIETLELSWNINVASITIRNLEDNVKTRLRVRAAEHRRSMEEEVRIILRDAVNLGRPGPRNLVEFTRECFASLGGIELELPKRGSMREPPNFS